jgi:hypothetical protein
MYVHMYVCMYECLHACVYVHNVGYVCMYVNICRPVYFAKCFISQMFRELKMHKHIGELEPKTWMWTWLCHEELITVANVLKENV